MITFFTILSIFILTFLMLLLLRKSLFLSSRKKLLLIPAILVIISGWFLIQKTVDELDDFKTRMNWESVNGEITEAKIVGLKTKEPQIEYSYIVKENIFKGESNLGIAMFGSNKAQDQTARNIVSNFQIGDSIKVYYNPKKENESVLKLTPHWSTFMQFSFALFLISIALTILVLQITNKQNIGNK